MSKDDVLEDEMLVLLYIMEEDPMQLYVNFNDRKISDLARYCIRVIKSKV